MDEIKLGKDPLFTLIEITHELRTRFSKISFFIRILAVFAAVSLMTSLISTVFYENKLHLQLMGLISLLHICNLLLSEFNQKWKHRYILLTIIIFHCLWLGLTALFIITYISILDEKDNSSKRDFNKEIHFHVVLIFYYAASVALIYYANDFCEYLIKNPAIVSKEETTIQTTSTSSTLPAGSPPSLPPPLPPPLPLVHPPSHKQPADKIANLEEGKVPLKLVNEPQSQLNPNNKVQPKVRPTLKSTKMPIKLNKVAKK